jgi:hypothetical protein
MEGRKEGWDRERGRTRRERGGGRERERETLACVSFVQSLRPDFSMRSFKTSGSTFAVIHGWPWASSKEVRSFGARYAGDRGPLL